MARYVAIMSIRSGRFLATFIRGSTGSGKARRGTFVVATGGTVSAAFALVLIIATASLCGATCSNWVFEQSRIQQSQVHLHAIQRGLLVLVVVCPLHIHFDVHAVPLAVPAQVDPRQSPKIVHRNRRHLLHHVLHRRGGAVRKERPASPQHGLVFRSEKREQHQRETSETSNPRGVMLAKTSRDCAYNTTLNLNQRAPPIRTSSFPWSPLARFFSLLHPVSTTMPRHRIWSRRCQTPCRYTACCFPEPTSSRVLL